jgi:kumamolisin
MTENPTDPFKSDAAKSDAASTSDALRDLELRPLPGSEREPVRGMVPAATAVPPDERIEATLILRRRAEVPDEALTAPLPQPEFAARYGASPADLDLVTGTLKRLGARILEADAGTRRVRVAGDAHLLGRIFGTTLDQVTSLDPTGGTVVSHRQRTGGLSVPAALDGVVTAVLGLDDRPQSRAQFRIAPAAAVTAGYTPLELGRIYRFPPGTDGSGQTIAIIELGGGFDQADLNSYFSGLGITGPVVTAVGVDGAANQPGQDPNGADGEVLLDIEVAGALAPAATILVYFAPNTDAGFVDAVAQAAHADPTPAAISISWGQNEDQWTAQARTAFDQALVDASALGVTVTAAAGDDGSADRATDGRVHVDFPASSPHALACGGTRLLADASTATVTSETVWNNGTGQGATGGGVSDAFELPSWQQNAGVPQLSGGAGKAGRGVPDVAGDADPRTGYRVRVDGADLVIGGTSAVSPLWAALVARLVQATGRKLGLLQPLLYRATTAGTPAPGFRDITSGNNGAYPAGPGWDACTGLGVPDGVRLLEVLQNGASVVT